MKNMKKKDTNHIKQLISKIIKKDNMIPKMITKMMIIIKKKVHINKATITKTTITVNQMNNKIIHNKITILKMNIIE